MDDEELHIWTHGVIEKLNNRPLILGAPLGITLTPNHVLQGFREGFRDQVNSVTPIPDSTEARNLAPAPSSRPEPTQDEFHPELAEINQ